MVRDNRWQPLPSVLSPYALDYAGVVVLIRPFLLGNPLRIRGYHLLCPACARPLFLDVRIDAVPDYQMVHANGKLTLVPSIECIWCSWRAQCVESRLHAVKRRSDGFRVV